MQITKAEYALRLTALIFFCVDMLDIFRIPLV